jgi:hypothetical protein
MTAIAPMPEPVVSDIKKTPTLIDYLLARYKRVVSLTQAQHQVLEAFQQHAAETLRANPPVSHRYEGGAFVLRLRDGKETPEVTLPLDGLTATAGDGSMAPQPHGPTHIQL